MKVPTESYKDIAKKYSDTINWMKSIGVSFGPGRTLHYQEVIDYWEDKYKAATKEEESKIFPYFVNSMWTSQTLLDTG